MNMLKFFKKMYISVYGYTSDEFIEHMYAQFNHYKDFYSYEEYLRYYTTTPPHEIIEEIKHFNVKVYLPF